MQWRHGANGHLWWCLFVTAMVNHLRSGGQIDLQNRSKSTIRSSMSGYKSEWNNVLLHTRTVTNFGRDVRTYICNTGETWRMGKARARFRE